MMAKDPWVVRPLALTRTALTGLSPRSPLELRVHQVDVAGHECCVYLIAAPIRGHPRP